MRTTSLSQQDSIGSMPRETSLKAIQRPVICEEALNCALLRQHILSAIAICSLLWLASSWLMAALAQAQESPLDESGISVNQPAPAQVSVATTEASHLVNVSMADRREVEPSTLPNSATQFTDPHSTHQHSGAKDLLPADSLGSVYASLEALASASSLPFAIQAKGSAHNDTVPPASDSRSLLYQLGSVNLVINGLPSSSSVSSTKSGVTGAR